MKVLLVWEEVPENTKFYVLEGEIADLALKCAGQYVNTVEETDEIEQLSEAIGGHPSFGIDEPIEGPFDKVVVAGFIM
jgi:hypothetical protein